MAGESDEDKLVWRFDEIALKKTTRPRMCHDTYRLFVSIGFFHYLENN